MIINWIAATTSESGLEVYAQLDQRDYPKGIEVSDSELAGDQFHPEWNHTIVPSRT